MNDPKRKMLLTKTKIREKFERRVHPSELKRRKFGDALNKMGLFYDFDRDISIDRTKLDLENAKQPLLHEKYLKEYIKAFRDKAHAETEFNYRKAGMIGAIKRNPSKYNIERVSEAAVQAVLPSHANYKEAENTYLIALSNFTMWEQRMRNIRDRVTILKNLVFLMDQGYYTPTSMSEED